MDERTLWAYAAPVPVVEYDEIVDESPVVPVVVPVAPVERESSVERLASLVYRLLMAYIWFWILLAAVVVVGMLVHLLS
jgi:hypothetical protein